MVWRIEKVYSFVVNAPSAARLVEAVGLENARVEIESMEHSKMIVVWGGKNILHKSIEVFLKAKPDWKVVSIVDLAELDHLQIGADSSQPDIVFILEGCHDDRLALKLFLDYPTCKVIQISLEDNLMDVYSIQKILFNRPADLLKVIEAGASTSFLL